MKIDGLADLMEGDIITFGGGLEVKPKGVLRQPDSEFAYMLEVVPHSVVSGTSSSQGSSESQSSKRCGTFSFFLLTKGAF